MKRKYRQVRAKLAAGTLILLGGLGVAGCKTSQKVELTLESGRGRRCGSTLFLTVIPKRWRCMVLPTESFKSKNKYLPNQRKRKISDVASLPTKTPLA